MRRTLGRKNQTKDIKAIRALSKVTDKAIACRIYNNADIAIDNARWTSVTFNTDARDAQAMHSTSGNTSRITVPIAGWYYMWGCVSFDANGTGIRGLAIREDGSVYTGFIMPSSTPGTATNCVLTVSNVDYLTASQYVELMVYQSSGGTLNIEYVNSYSPFFAVSKFPFDDSSKTEFSIPRIP